MFICLESPLRWNDNLKAYAKEVVRIVNGRVIIEDEPGYALFVEQYEKDRAVSAEFLPTWEELLGRIVKR